MCCSSLQFASHEISFEPFMALRKVNGTVGHEKNRISMQNAILTTILGN
jgi:hypothetical protein